MNKFRGIRKRRIGGEIEEEKWVEHFSKLLNSEERGEGGEREWTDINESEEENTNTRYMNEEINEKEIGEALSRMADGKATGEDGIPIEAVKRVYSAGGGGGEIKGMGMRKHSTIA